MSGSRISSEEGLKKRSWMDALSGGGLHQTRKDAVGLESGFRSRSEAYLAKDNQMSEGLFRMIVRGGYAGAPEESEKKSLLGACEVGAEGLGRFETKQLFADAVEFPDEAFLDLGCLLPGDSARFELLPHVAES